MLDPVIEEEEGDGSEHRSGLKQTTLGVEGLSKSHSFADPAKPPRLSRSNRPYRHRLISRHNPQAVRVRSTPGPPPSSPTLSANDSPPPSSLVRRPSIAPPPDPKRLSEEALLHALHNIRIEEEEELSFRRKSLRIVEIPGTVLPLPFKETADKSSVPGSEAQPDTSDENAQEAAAPYAGCSVYQLACSRERLRDMEQQLQNAVCMMQDTVELVARRLRDANKDGSGEEDAKSAVESMRDQLERLVGAHERVSMEHGLVTREMEARPGNLWEEMARRMDFHVNRPQAHRN